jgi:ubiquinone/menaquinone biosynthesis C-methylase UbiE
MQAKEMNMALTSPTSNDQTTLWNGPAGRAWVEMQETIDLVLKPFEDLLVDAVSIRSGVRMLDIGCGTGATTLAVARRLGGNGSCVGLDLSEPMINLARVRAEREGSPATFIHADAQTYPFEPMSFDMIVSRFGVMFFDDPVRAFSGLRRAAADDADLRFIAWRSAAENPFMTTAERAAAPLLPDMPARRSDGPGQFAFADQHRVKTILKESGWSAIAIRPIDVTCTLPEKELVRYFTRLGPVGQFLQEADERSRTEILESVRAAFDPYVQGSEVRFTGACWMVHGQART